MPGWVITVAVVVAMTVAATVTVVLSKGRPADMGHAEVEYDRTGRIPYRRMPAAAAYSLTSLWSGAIIGPEAPLIDINGGIGSWLADRFPLGREHVRTLSLRGRRRRVLGVLRGGPGRRPAGRRADQPQVREHQPDDHRRRARGGRRRLGRVSQLGGHAISPIIHFDPSTTVTLGDLLFAVPLGIGGAVIGLAYGGVMLRTGSPCRRCGRRHGGRRSRAPS